MPPTTNPKAFVRALLYSSASVLLLADAALLFRTFTTGNDAPIGLAIAGILAAAGLLVIVIAEQKERDRDKREHHNIARVAHQLQTPLLSLQQQFDHLIKAADKLPAELRITLKQMETKTNVLLDNIRDVFLELQAQTGNISQNVRSYNLCALVQEAYDRNKLLAAAHNVELIYQAHCSDAPIVVDRRLFLIALSHIIENAIMYTMAPGLVNVAVVRGKHYVRVIIQDRGVGIAPADRNAVWRPFMRGQMAEKYHPDGIGVGVTLTRRIIKEIGGTISWKNRAPNLGTQFEIKLPLVT